MREAVFPNPPPIFLSLALPLSSHMTGELESEVILCVYSSLLPPSPPVQLLVLTIAMVGGLGA